MRFYDEFGVNVMGTSKMFEALVSNAHFRNGEECIVPEVINYVRTDEEMVRDVCQHRDFSHANTHVQSRVPYLVRPPAHGK